MFIFLLFAQFVLINSNRTASGRRCLVGAPAGTTDVCMGFCAFEISWGVEWEWWRAGGLGWWWVCFCRGCIVWDHVSLGLCTKRVSALSLCCSLGLMSETQWPSLADCVTLGPYPLPMYVSLDWGCCALVLGLHVCCGHLHPVFLSLGLLPSRVSLLSWVVPVSLLMALPNRTALTCLHPWVWTGRVGRVRALSPEVKEAGWEVSSWRLDFLGSQDERREKDPGLVWDRARPGSRIWES